MLETPHVVVGAAIAAKVGNPFLAIPLAFGSHFLLDKVPHWNPHLNTEIKKYGHVTKQSKELVIADVALSVLAGGLISWHAMPDVNQAFVILLGGFAGVLPDVIEGPYFFLKMKSKFILRWIKFQKSIQVDTTPLPGLLTQAVTVAAAFAWVLR
ncbi:MAG TPA: hypothetical protein VF185_00080 [Patescibacteria group bacterium]